MDKKIDPKRTWPKGYEPKEDPGEDLSIRLGLMTNILNKKTEKKKLLIIVTLTITTTNRFQLFLTVYNWYKQQKR